jgi:hypothetical protein
MRRLLREPLVHFLLIGAALFVAFGLAGKPSGGAAGSIVVSKAQVASLASGFTSTWQRPPTPAELEELIQDHVREEVYYREALTLGLDKDDATIRRRLRQKMEFFSDDLVPQMAPTDAELAEYLKAHPQTFRAGPRFSFSHVYLDPKKHGQNLSHDAARLLERLARSGDRVDAARWGDSIALEHAFHDLPEEEVVKRFGAPFAASLSKLSLGRWEGPIESGYGAHLVFLDTRTAGAVPELSAVRDRVAREWTDARRLEANEAFYQGLLKKYRVTIERP